MKLTKFLFLFVTVLVVSCTNDSVDTTNNNSEDIQNTDISKRPNYRPSQEVHWVSGESWAVFLDGMRIGSMCLNLGRCYGVVTYNPSYGHFAATEVDGGKPVKFTMIDDQNLRVELLDAGISVAGIQREIDGIGGSDVSADEIFNALSSRVNLEDEMRLGTELSQLLNPEGNGQEIVILPGEYPIDYSNSAYGEFIVTITQN